MILQLGEETGVPGENPRCQVGAINPVDTPDGSGQHLRVATIELRPSRLTTWPAWQPSSESGRPRSLASRLSPIQVVAGRVLLNEVEAKEALPSHTKNTSRGNSWARSSPPQTKDEAKDQNRAFAARTHTTE